jgi:hypothetical protein
LLSGLAVHGAAWRTRHLRAGLLPLFSVHPRPAALLSTPGLWHSLFYPALYNAAMMLGHSLVARSTESQSSEMTDELPFLVTSALF